MAGQKVFGECFRTLPFFSTCGWAADFQPGGAEGIEYAFHPRRVPAAGG
ncbi:hypothetical protein HmCmsJML006_02175 [Escherichia coli]|nr:hypothetical protein HmCmsJML006_02175 [Escherichia coli]